MKHRPLSLFPLLLLGAPLLAQDLDLRTSARKGNSVWLTVEQKLEQVTELGGQEMESGQNVTRVLHVAVKDVDDQGNLLVETKIARVRGSMSLPMMGMEVEFDSADAADGDDEGGGLPGIGQFKKAMLVGAGKSFTAKVDGRGRVIELKDGAAEILKAGANPTGGGGMDENALKQIVESAFGRLPEKPVAVGSKWEDTQQQASGGVPIQQKLELTLTNADDESFEITASGTVAKPEEKPTGEPEADDPEESPEDMARRMMQSMKIQNGKLSGTTRVSRKDGFVIDATSKVSMDVEVAGPMGDMAMVMKSTTTTKRAGPEAAGAKDGAEPKDGAKGEAKEGAGAKEPAKEGGK